LSANATKLPSLENALN